MQPNLIARLIVCVLLASCLLPVSAQTPAGVSPNTDAPAATTVSADGRHTLNLRAADIGVLVQTVSEITGKSFILDPRVEGRVTVISSKPQDAEEIYATFLSVLRVHGFAAVASGNMIKIVPDAVAAQDGSLGNGGGGPDAVVTRLISLKHVSADDVVKLLRPLAPQQATLTATAGNDAILINDRAGNIDRLVQLIQRMDTVSDSEVEVIPLRHASAAQVARTLATLEGADGTSNTGKGQNLIADERTNSILLSGDPASRLRLRTLIAHLDTPLDGGENTQVIYLNYAKAEDLVSILDAVAGTLTGEGGAAGEDGKGRTKAATIQAHPETNALIITASPAVFRELSSVVRQLDVRRAQVLVEAVIAEVTDELADEIGVQWQSTNFDGERGYIGGTNYPGAGGVGSIINAMQNPLGALGAASGAGLGWVGGRVDVPDGKGGTMTLFQVGALVKALRGDGRANVLSNPSIVTLDNSEAQFKVVQEVPFLTGQYTNTSSGGTNMPTNPFQTVERKDVGLILTVTPHINEGDAVRLEVKQEVSSIASTVTGAVDLITNKRELTTTVLVPDGGMLVLGGLKQEETHENAQGVPGLSRIPLLGNLFKSRSSTRSKRNLMVFLRPIILRDAATEAAVSSEKYNFLRAEQMLMREDRSLRYHGDKQPLLPELEPISPPDLFRNPPPVDPATPDKAATRD
ncbi:MAG TPA: type II secretion system secretin GspD [Chiayiivirga sp.]|nr:type II secretion system secretin GspD [Chiayiivirga sp.]